jgi:hypothetical protein
MGDPPGSPALAAAAVPIMVSCVEFTPGRRTAAWPCEAEARVLGCCCNAAVPTGSRRHSPPYVPLGVRVSRLRCNGVVPTATAGVWQQFGSSLVCVCCMWHVAAAVVRVVDALVNDACVCVRRSTQGIFAACCCL